MYGSASTFDTMMQGFYRDLQGRTKSIAHYLATLESNLNEIWVMHPNRVSEAETAGYIKDHILWP